MNFILSEETEIISDYSTKGIENAVWILQRDIKKVLSSAGKVKRQKNRIILTRTAAADEEQFILEVGKHLTISARDELGFIYGLLYISEQFMGINPFWFWMDQKIEKRDCIEIPYGCYRRKKPVIRFRGWFINDEVLFMKWKIGGDKTEPWRMAFEALLRCGGNMVIPGTDKNEIKYRQLAFDMGLWITHHHIAPLGAKMFIREYPDKKPDYDENQELFIKLWKDAIEEQKNQKVIWTLGFRGQGDGPFWGHDEKGKYNTSEKRGELISKIIELQRQLVLERVENPIFCTNLYAEAMELYDEGYLELSDDIIKIRSDNGYGKMVTRRRGNYNARIPALPREQEKHGGIYYHVSFYDLQAANHITMLQNSVDFVNSELSKAMKKNVNDFWIFNCSNVRPHVYYLDAIRKKWYGEVISDKNHSREFAEEYFHTKLSVADAYYNYHRAMILYGNEEDEHAGEQFYTENIRMLVHALINGKKEGTPDLWWITGEIPLDEQIKKYTDLCKNNLDIIGNYYRKCTDISNSLEGREKQLFDATIFLHASIHYYCTKAVADFGVSYKAFLAKDWKRSFMLAGHSAESFEEANTLLRKAEYGVWKGFYYNECFADIKHSAYMVKKYMGIIREAGDDSYHVKWYRDAVYTEKDREITALFVTDNHMTDWELYEAFKKQEADILSE